MAANNVQTSGTSTLSYTPSNVTDAVLVVVVGSEDVSNNSPITGVDFGATAMTLGDIGEGINGPHANDCAIYYLANPGTSAATITVNGGERQSIVAMTLDGIDQTTPVDVSDGVGYTNEASITTSATTTVDNCLVVSGICTEDTGHSFTFSSATEIADFAGTSQRTGSATSTQASAGTYTHTITVPTGVPATRIGVASVAFQPAAGGGVDTLAADGVSSASTIAPASIGQLNGLNAASIESGSEASTVAVGQRHGLSAVAVDSASDISTPGVGQSFVLVGDGAVSLSSISIPGLLQSHLLAAADVVSLPEISIPSVAQRHDIYADDSAALSEVSVPTLSEGSHLLSADDVSSSVLIGVPGIGQVQVLMPLAVQSLSALDQPSLGSGVGLYADGVEAASVITAPGLGQEYVLSLDGVSAASQVDAPDLQQWHVLLGDSVSVLSSIGLVALGDGSESVPTMEIQLRACRSVVARATTSVTVTH